jgi:hypothetical protein
MAKNEPNLRTSSYTAAVAQSIDGAEKQSVSNMTASILMLPLGQLQLAETDECVQHVQFEQHTNDLVSAKRTGDERMIDKALHM